MLDALITSKTRLKLLIKFFVSASNHGHLRGLADEFRESTNSIRKELNQLSEAGYLEKEHVQNKVIYRANIKHSLFQPLQKLIHTYLGIEDIVDHVLNKSGDVEEVSVVGDYAKGLESGVIEVLILGQNINQAYLLRLADKVGQKMNKDIHVYFKEAGLDLQRIVLYAK